MAKSVISIHTDEGVEDYHGPSGWDDLSRKDLLLWSGILRQELTRDEALYLACVRMYGIPKSRYLLLPEVYDLHLVWRMEWLLENRLVKNVIGQFRLFFTSYYGPGNRLSNLTIAEYRMTELYYDAYLRTGLNKYLYLLCAVLFRPKGNAAVDDVRCVLNEADVNRRAKWFERFLHPNYVKAIQLQYEGCRSYIRKAFPLVYPKAVADDSVVLDPFVGKKQVGIADLQEHILAFAGDKLGTYADTEKTNLYLFMKHMTMKIEEYNERKRK